MEDSPKLFICTVCEEALPLASYYPTNNGYRAKCKTCYKSVIKAWQQKNKEKRRAIAKEARKIAKENNSPSYQRFKERNRKRTARMNKVKSKKNPTFIARGRARTRKNYFKRAYLRIIKGMEESGGSSYHECLQVTMEKLKVKEKSVTAACNWWIEMITEGRADALASWRSRDVSPSLFLPLPDMGTPTDASQQKNTKETKGESS